MRYVLDSSVGLKLVLPESDSGKAIRLRDESRQGIHQLIAPDVFPIEVGHVLSKAERQGRIGQGDGPGRVAGRAGRRAGQPRRPRSDGRRLSGGSDVPDGGAGCEGNDNWQTWH